MAKIKTLHYFSRGQERLTHVCPESPEALVGHEKDKRGRDKGGEEFGLPHTFYPTGWGRGEGTAEEHGGLMAYCSSPLSFV